MRSLFKIAMLAGAIGATPPALAEIAGSRILDEIQVVSKGDAEVILIHFAVPVRYVQHLPASSGTLLQIRMRPITAADFDADSPHHESLQWSPSRKVPLAEVSLDGENIGDSTLVLRFNRSVTFNVVPGEDFRSIGIELVKSTAAAEWLPGPSSQAPEKSAPAETSQPSGASAGPDAGIMEQGRRALIDKDYPSAIGYFTKVLKSSATEHHQEAQELLGLARERNSQTARAKLEYEKYLERYPEGEGADRVRQRIASLLTAKSAPKEKLKPTNRGTTNPEWEFYGGFSQFYLREASITDKEGEVVHQSALFSNLDFTSRYRGDRLDLRTQLNARYLHDFEESDDSQFRLSNAYIDGSDRDLGLSARLGRQSRSTGGVLGRFDGGVVSYRFLPKWQFSAVGGFPVETFRSGSLQTDRSFYGFSLDFGPFAEYWAGNAFFIDQEVDGITDRRAIGGELRYQHPRHPVFALVDYDISHDALNIFQMVGNYFFSNGAAVNLTADYRKVPFLSTSNALQGEFADSVGDLLKTRTESEIRELARDRTATARSLILGGSYPITENFQITGDFTYTKLSGLGASGDLPATEGTGDEFSYAAQLTASSLFKSGDVSVFGLRYTDKRDFDIYSLSIDSRYPLSENWRLDPRLRVDYYSGPSDGDFVRVRPSLRLNYRWKKNLTFEAEGGVEWSDKPLFPDENDHKSYFFSFGYRWNF